MARDRNLGIADVSMGNDKFTHALYSRQVQTCILIRLKWKLSGVVEYCQSVGSNTRHPELNVPRSRTIVCEIARVVCVAPARPVAVCTRVWLTHKICSLYCFARLKNQVVKG